MSDTTYNVGDLVRVIASTAAAQAGEEGRVMRVEHDTNGEIAALDILFDSDPARTRGTTVFAHEVERIAAHSASNTVS